MAECVGEHAKRAQRGIDRIEILDLVVEIALRRRIKFAARSLESGPSEQSEEIEILFRWRERKWIDLEVLGFESDTDVEPPKRCVRLSKLPPRSKMNVYGAYFCRFVIRKFSRNDFPAPVRPRIIVCATSR